MRFCPATSAFFVQGPPLWNFTKKIRGNYKTKNQKPSANGLPWGSARRGSVVPISSEPAPSHRPWTFASGGTVLAVELRAVFRAHDDCLGLATSAVMLDPTKQLAHAKLAIH